MQELINILVVTWPGILLGLGYGIVGYLKSGGDFDLGQFAKAIVYSVVAGGVAYANGSSLDGILAGLTAIGGKKYLWNCLAYGEKLSLKK